MSTRRAEETPGEIKASARTPTSLTFCTSVSPRSATGARHLVMSVSSPRGFFFFFFSSDNALTRRCSSKCARDAAPLCESVVYTTLTRSPRSPISSRFPRLCVSASPGGVSDPKRARRDSFGPWGDPKKKYLYYCPQMKELATSIAAQVGNWGRELGGEGWGVDCFS